MAIQIDNPEYTKPKYEYIKIYDVSGKSEEEKNIIFDRELHFEEWPDLSKDSQLKNIMTNGTSSIDYSVRINTSDDENPKYIFKLSRTIINDDPNIDINLIDPDFIQPKKSKDMLKFKKEEANRKYELSCYNINAEKIYKKYKHK